MKFRVYLRALELEDYLITYEWRKDEEIYHILLNFLDMYSEEIQNMVGGPKFFISKEKERQWILNTIQDQNRMVLGICLKENDQLIGTVNIQDIDWVNRSAHVPILIGNKSYWGGGYASEARILALKFAFYERGIHRIWALVLEDNIPSLKLHERMGYVKEGLLRDSVYKNGRFQNQVYMGLLKEDFDKVYQDYCEKYRND